MLVYLYSISSVIIVSLISLIGIFTLSLQEHILRKYVFILVSLAVGALLGDAFIHLLPELFENAPNASHVSILIIAGIFIFFILEKVLHWHHTHGFEKETQHQVGSLILISDGVHNFIDGLIIGASYIVGIEIGIATTLAVILHEIPQEIGDFGVLLHAGFSKVKALWLNFLSGLFAIVGVITALLLSETAESFTAALVPLAAGGFIYIALSDLIPELHKTKGIRSSIIQFIAIAVGVGAMAFLLIFE